LLDRRSFGLRAERLVSNKSEATSVWSAAMLFSAQPKQLRTCSRASYRHWPIVRHIATPTSTTARHPLPLRCRPAKRQHARIWVRARLRHSNRYVRAATDAEHAGTCTINVAATRDATTLQSPRRARDQCDCNQRSRRRLHALTHLIARTQRSRAAVAAVVLLTHIAHSAPCRALPTKHRLHRLDATHAASAGASSHVLRSCNRP
jgi:hypothetical protein